MPPPKQVSKPAAPLSDSEYTYEEDESDEESAEPPSGTTAVTAASKQKELKQLVLTRNLQEEYRFLEKKEADLREKAAKLRRDELEFASEKEKHWKAQTQQLLEALSHIHTKSQPSRPQSRSRSRSRHQCARRYHGARRCQSSGSTATERDSGRSRPIHAPPHVQKSGRTKHQLREWKIQDAAPLHPTTGDAFDEGYRILKKWSSGMSASNEL